MSGGAVGLERTPHEVGPIEPHRLAQVSLRANAVIDEVQRVYVGTRTVPELLLVTLLAKGHALLEGVPGVAKTTLCKAFAATPRS